MGRTASGSKSERPPKGWPGVDPWDGAAEPDFPYYFDAEAADDAEEFVETLLRLWKGRRFAGKPFKLLWWQRFTVRSLFGWKRKEDGLRRYRSAYIEVPKKNGKTPFAAALILLCLFTDGEPGAEIYSAAGDKRQAGLVFEHAKAMIQRSIALRRRARCLTDRILLPSLNSFYERLSSDAGTKHGLDIHAFVFDELHAQTSRELWDTLVGGDTARDQPLRIVITTAGEYDPNSIGWEEHDVADRAIRGVLDPPDLTHFAVIFSITKEQADAGKWKDRRFWYQANPSLGEIIPERAFKRLVDTAIATPAKQNSILRLHFNVWTSALTRAIDLAQWDRSAAEPDVLDGEECTGGLDLSSKLDLTAFVLFFPRTNSIVPFFWIPEANMKLREDRDRVPYRAWCDAGIVTATEGNRVDQKAVRKTIVECAERFDLRDIGFDPWNATQISTELQDEDGLTVTEMRQGYRTLSEPTKNLIGLVRDGELRHGGNPCLRWNADNLELRKDPNDNWAPKKGRASNRIDGMVALIMALGRAMLDSEDAISEDAFRVLGADGASESDDDVD